jgi:hypothetical protein
MAREKRAIDSLKTSEKERFREVDGASRQAGVSAGLAQTRHTTR